MNKKEATEAAIRILTRDARMIEKQADSYETNSSLAGLEPRVIHMKRFGKELREIIAGLQNISDAGDEERVAKFELSAEQARMLMNYLDRAHVVDRGVIRASVEFDQDGEGVLETLLRSIVAECRRAYLTAVAPEAMKRLKGLADGEQF